MSEFNLESWEMPLASLSPSAGEADAVIEANWRGQRREFMLRVVRLRDVYGCTFAREKDSSDTGSWLLAGRRRGVVTVWNTVTKPPLQKVAEAIENGDIELARFCVLSDGKQTRRAITFSSGESMWLSVGMGNQEKFNLPISEEDFLSNGRTQVESLSEELTRPASDARFALNWLRWAQSKRQSYILSIEGLRKLEHLMRCVLFSDSSLWERADNWVWDLYQGGVHLGLLYSPLEHSSHVEKENPRFIQLAQLIVDKYPRAVNAEDLAKHQCVQWFYERNFFWPMVWAETPPTYHERLEARSRLREWLHQNAPERMDLLP
ncbi:hypothetical protein IAD21_04669 [Abditibacteriota bacterium]|nr:hypothetical protein IAD21_04669 [Abditibacteriota bacterium]